MTKHSQSGALMKAAIFEARHQPLTVREIPVPQPGAGELLIRVEACGVCGSDLHATEGALQTGTVLGHEYSGTVVETGQGVEADWQPGDKLIAIAGQYCGKCPACLRGEDVSCEHIVMQGFDLRMPGAYAEFTVCQANMAFKVPPGFDMRQAAAVEPLAVGLNAWKSANVAAGSDVLILGAGPIGVCLVKWACFFGAREIGVHELVDSRLRRAKEAGATVLVDSSFADPVLAFRAQTGRAPTVIFECIGRPMIRSIVKMAPKAAHIVMVGTCMESESVKVAAIAVKRLCMTFAYAYERADFEFVLAMLVQGRMSVDPLITSTVNLDALPQMFESLKQPNDQCKVLLMPQAVS